MKIVILDGYTENPGDLSWAGFEKLGELTVYKRTPLGDEDEIARRIGDAEVVYTNKTPLTKAVLDRCPDIRYIGVLATGFNVVDTAAARERGIPVCNIPSYGTNAVAQFAIGLLLEICHHIGHHSEAVHAGRWEKSGDFCFWDYPLIELAGKTMGIIGYGRIGRATGRMAKGMGMNILAYDANKGPDDGGVATFCDLDTLFAQSDVIALHCPLTPQTDKIINAKSLAKMKNGVILLNNSRGQLIDEQALADALKFGKVYGAGLDVVSSEPIREDNPLFTAPNCILTPHISWAPKESRQRLMDAAVQNLENFLAGKPSNVVNP